MATKTYTLEEVKKHSNGQDCWVVIDDKVYDITKFIDEHPGGEEVLLEQAGRDATIQFEDVGHSEDARELLADYLIGTLDKNDILKTDIGKTGKPLLSVEKGEDSSNFTMIVASLLVVGAAIASYFFYFNR